MAGIPANFKAALLLSSPVIMITLAAIYEQVRYPEAGAWIVAFIGVLFLVLIYAVGRLANREVEKE